MSKEYSESEEEYEVDNVADDGAEEAPTVVAAPEKPVGRQGKKKDPTTEDKRSKTSVSNIEKARNARLKKIQQQREAAANQYEIESSSDEDNPTELVIQKKKKPVLATATEARLMKLELLLEKIALQEKAKKPRAPRKIVIQQAPAPVAPKVAAPVAQPVQEHLKKKILLDL